MLKAMLGGRSSSSLESPSRTRMWILPMGNLSLPSLSWWDRDRAPTPHKPPLLSLKSSSHSFLESSIHDDLSAAAVYTIKTRRATTTVLRCGGQEDFVTIAMIKWPGVVSTKETKEHDNNSPLIKMRGCDWSKGETVLRPGSNSNSSSKFIVPNCSHTMKWKRYGTSYWCTTSGIKGPIATLDLARGRESIRLAVYETLYDKYDPQGLSVYKGVSFILLDYLIVTALLYVTDDAACQMVIDKVCDDIVTCHGADAGSQSLPYTPESPEHPYAVVSRELHSIPSQISLSAALSASPQSSGSYAIAMPTYVESESPRSRWYSGTSTIEDGSKDYWPLLHNIKPDSSAVSGAGVSSSHAFVKSRTISVVPPLPSQFSKSPAGQSASTLSPRHELSHLLHQPHPTSIDSPLPSSKYPFGLEERKLSPPSKHPPNFSKPTHTPSRSESQRRPLPTPPKESEIRRVQSSSQLTNRHIRRMKSLPPTPLFKSPDVSRASAGEGNSHLQAYAQAPSMTKVSEENLGQWVHELKNPRRVLPSTPLPETVISDVPPPYAAIYPAQRAKQHCIPTPTALST